MSSSAKTLNFALAAVGFHGSLVDRGMAQTFLEDAQASATKCLMPGREDEALVHVVGSIPDVSLVIFPGRFEYIRGGGYAVFASSITEMELFNRVLKVQVQWHASLLITELVKEEALPSEYHRAPLVDVLMAFLLTEEAIKCVYNRAILEAAYPRCRDKPCIKPSRPWAIRENKDWLCVRFYLAWDQSCLFSLHADRFLVACIHSAAQHSDKKRRTNSLISLKAYTGPETRPLISPPTTVSGE